MENKKASRKITLIFLMSDEQKFVTSRIMKRLEET